MEHEDDKWQFVWVTPQGTALKSSWVEWDFPVSQHGKFECKGKIQLDEGTFSSPSWMHQGFCKQHKNSYSCHFCHHISSATAW